LGSWSASLGVSGAQHESATEHIKGVRSATMFLGLDTRRAIRAS